MNRIVFVLAVLGLIVAIGIPEASAGTGDGSSHSFNWLRDDDGDGIPNGLDDDWTRPLDCNGYQMKHGFGTLVTGFYVFSTEDGNVVRNQHRHRKNPADSGGDRTRTQNQLRDGSCE
jgi:hypothetical protein